MSEAPRSNSEEQPVVPQEAPVDLVAEIANKEAQRKQLKVDLQTKSKKEKPEIEEKINKLDEEIKELEARNKEVSAKEEAKPAVSEEKPKSKKAEKEKMPSKPNLLKQHIEKKRANYIERLGRELSPAEKKRSIASWTRELWTDFAVHGRIRKNEKGEYEVANEPDLDVKFSLQLLRMVGIEPNVIFVAPGEQVEGITTIDTGGIDGRKISDDRETYILDHHSRYTESNTCAAKLLYDDLVRMKMLRPGKHPGLKEAVDLVNDVDNKTFYKKPYFEKEFEGENRRKREQKYFEKSDKRLTGLADKADPVELINFFKEKKERGDKVNLVGILKEGDIKKLGLERRSENMHWMVGKSKEAIEQMDQDRMWVNSKKYGKILVDIPTGKKKMVPCGFDAARAYGYGAYVIWNREENSFFVTTVEEFDKGHKFDQGTDLRSRHMYVHSKDPLRIGLEHILDVMTDGKLEAKGKLAEYLEKEKPQELTPQEALEMIDKRPAMRGIASHEKLERGVNKEFKNEENYAPGVELGIELKNSIAGVLEGDEEFLRQDFYVKWFDDHKTRIQEEGQAIDIDDKKKADFVFARLDHKDWIIRADMRGEYRRQFGDRIDKIMDLREDLKRGKIPAETPALLLNHLQKKHQRLKVELEEIKDSGQESLIINKEEKIEEIFNLRKELAQRISGKNFDELAKREEYLTEGAFPTEENYVESLLGPKQEEVTRRKNEELIEKEWVKFRGLETYEEKLNFYANMGLEDIQPQDFYDRERFKDILFQCAKEEFRSEEKDGDEFEPVDFYALLETGYKPHTAAVRGFRRIPNWLVGLRGRVTIAKVENGKEVEKNMSTKKLDELIENSRTEREKSIRDQAEKELKEDWNRTKNELGRQHTARVRDFIEERIRYYAESPERARGGTEGVYRESRNRIIQEFITKRKSVAPVAEKPKVEPEKEAKPEAKVSGKEEKVAEVIIDSFHEADKRDKGEFSGFGKLSDADDIKILNKFFKKRGIDAHKFTKDILPDELEKVDESKRIRLPALINKIMHYWLEE